MKRPLLAGLLLALAAAPLPGGPGKISSLLANSPFGRTGPDAVANTEAADPVEFRAVLEENGGRSFCLFESAARVSTWVGLQEPVNGLVVKAYDGAKETILVEYRGLILSLPLKRAAPAVNAHAPLGRANPPTSTTREMIVTETAVAEEATPAPTPEEEARARFAEAVLSQYREQAQRQRLAR